jgi:hypothetical protein
MTLYEMFLEEVEKRQIRFVDDDIGLSFSLFCEVIEKHVDEKIKENLKWKNVK